MIHKLPHAGDALPNLSSTNGQHAATVYSRAIAGGNFPSEAAQSAFTFGYAEHFFIELDDGKRLFYGGNTRGDDHWTARSWPIYIPKDADLDDFTKCVKEGWPDDERDYSSIRNNCRQQLSDVLSECLKRARKAARAKAEAESRDEKKSWLSLFLSPLASLATPISRVIDKR